MLLSNNMKKIVLSDEEADFFNYFIKQYLDHFKKGELAQAHHCCVGVLLELDRIITDSDDEENKE